MSSPFTDSLRQVADAIDAGTVPQPSALRFFLGSAAAPGCEVKEQFLAARAAFPAATVDTSDDYYVSVVLPGQVHLRFDKNRLGTRTTVTREVVEYVLDPELVTAPVPA